MQLHAERFPLAITECAPGHIVWVGQRITRSVLLRNWLDTPQDWGDAGFDGLGAEDFALLSEGQPDVVLFGSGQQLRFAPQPWLAPLALAGLSLEVMNTAAACRTWNVLVGEGRRVAAALLLESAAHLY